MADLIALLLMLIPVLLAVIFARRYNFVLGFLSFFFFAYVLVFVAGLVPSFAGLMTTDNINNGFNQFVAKFMDGYTLDLIPKLNELSWYPYVKIAVWAIVFIILWIIGSKIRKHRKNKNFEKYSNVKVVEPRY